MGACSGLWGTGCSVLSKWPYLTLIWTCMTSSDPYEPTRPHSRWMRRGLDHYFTCSYNINILKIINMLCEKLFDLIYLGVCYVSYHVKLIIIDLYVSRSHWLLEYGYIAGHLCKRDLPERWFCSLHFKLVHYKPIFLQYFRITVISPKMIMLTHTLKMKYIFHENTYLTWTGTFARTRS